MRVITWNINSVRLRLPLLLELIDEQQPDVFCLQETKARDEFFPVMELVAAGYKHYHFTGMKSYNGVAIFSRVPLSSPKIYKRCGKDDCRHISVKVEDKKTPFELHNIYIPAGGYEPDPINNEKFKHKLDFVDELTKWFKRNRSADDAVMVVGDLNIAPLEHDVWDHKKMLKTVSHTPIEVEKFTKFYNSLKWVDAMRHFVPESEKLYTWWSYRAKDWHAADKGRRLDHMWVTKKLKCKLKVMQVLKDMRGVDRPSDHAPVVLEF